MDKFKQLWNIIEKLRDPVEGCAWDREQTAKSLIPNFIEELYETVEAIENENNESLTEELGDLLLHILMQIKIANEKGMMTPDDVIEGISQKLIRRHPHIFNRQNDGSDCLDYSATEVRENWEKIKHDEKKKSRKSILSGIPKAMPALIYAQRMQEKAASTGFDWNNATEVLPKIDEELEELKETLKDNNIERETEEVGDLLFSVVNFCRKRGIDSESALKRASEKFRNRFVKIEEYHYNQDENIFNSSVEKLNELWEQTKKGPRPL
ncbi:MAG: nucleoside triphosphate pyrophosphohydrolase [Candidatus Cloacimonas sp.]|nr:nucleoside triphosphate pyrophosphohydrolase [Candidatus Cloacimonadota bacterium]